MADINFDGLKTVADFTKAAGVLGDNVTEGTVMVRLANLHYSLGVWGKNDPKRNAIPDNVPVIGAFNAKYRGEGTGRKALTGNSETTFVSTFFAFVEAGYEKRIDASPIVAWIIANAKGAFTERAAVLRKMLKHFAEATPVIQPTEELVKAWAVANAKKAAGLKEKATSVKRGVEAIFEDKAMASMIEGNSERMDAYMALIEAAEAFVATTIEASTDDKDKKAQLLRARAAYKATQLATIE